MPNILAQDIVNAVIQDSQSQTTNRTALYDYVDRVHQRILRESQWRFLLSDPLYFATLPGVAAYGLTNGALPPWAFKTNLNLSNFQNIAPFTVFNATSWQQIEEDSDTETTLSSYNFRDASLRSGSPRTYQNLIQYPGTIVLKPAPDGKNLYYPVPETPYTTYVPTNFGTNLPNRTYFGVVTFSDAFGGESTPCTIPFTIAVPYGNLVVVSSPQDVVTGIAGNQQVYSGWNVYIGTTLGTYFKQNISPIPIGVNWTEPGTGIALFAAPIVNSFSILSNATVTLQPTGFLVGTTPATGTPEPWTLQAPNGSWWEVEADPVTNIVFTNEVAPSSNPFSLSAIYMYDTGLVTSWAITVQNDGQLNSMVGTPPPAGAPPLVSSITPLNTYVIQFRYFMQRNQIVNPTDILQIPYNYKDVVVAGVNYMANMYMDRALGTALSEKTREWKALFEQGLAQIRRDLRINFRKTDYINPDPMSQYVVGNQQGIPTMGW